MEKSKDVSPKTGFHFRLELEHGDAVELDALRFDPIETAEALLQVTGRRRDGSTDSVTVSIPLAGCRELYRALGDVHAFLMTRRAQAIRERKRRGAS